MEGSVLFTIWYLLAIGVVPTGLITIGMLSQKQELKTLYEKFIFYMYFPCAASAILFYPVFIGAIINNLQNNVILWYTHDAGILYAAIFVGIIMIPATVIPIFQFINWNPNK